MECLLPSYPISQCATVSLMVTCVSGCPTGGPGQSEVAKGRPGDSVPGLQSGRLARHPDPTQQPHRPLAGLGTGQTDTYTYLLPTARACCW